MQSARHGLSAPAAIRPATEKDIEPIRELAHRIWPDCFAGILTPAQIANMLEHIYSPESLKRQMREGQLFWIASDNARNLGYASAYEQDGTIWLKKLYLEAAARGTGLGARLMENAVSAFLPAHDIRLCVNRDNISAHVFYERMGFAHIDEIKVMMGDYPFIDYVYRKPLI